MSRYSTDTPMSPKVSWGALVGVLAAIVGAVLSALLLNPDGLGVALPTWALFLLAAGGPVVLQAITAYVKRDPLRDEGRASLNGQAIQAMADRPVTPLED